MLLDPDNKYIETINSHAPLTGATILEIGCGDGRITGDMASYATKVVATDLNPKALEQAKKLIPATNIDFVYTPNGIPDFPAQTFDIVVYTLSLHHIPKDKMRTNLHLSGNLLKKGGKIVVVEPGDGGSFLEVKKRFGAGSGDESKEKQAAMDAMQTLDNWIVSPTYHFNVSFLFQDEADFFSNKLPNYQDLPTNKIIDLKNFLKKNRTPKGIVLTSGRSLNILTRKISSKK